MANTERMAVHFELTKQDVAALIITQKFLCIGQLTVFTGQHKNMLAFQEKFVHFTMWPNRFGLSTSHQFCKNCDSHYKHFGLSNPVGNTG